jgi:ketosteroid isomerase-like protein
MSQENVEVVRRSYEIFNSGDIEGWLATLSPDVELDERYLAPDAAVYRGHVGVRGWWNMISEAGSARFEVLRWLDGGDAVATEVMVHVRGAESGVDVTARLAHAVRVRDQKVVYIASFPTVEQAREAAGLSEHAMSQENVEIVAAVIRTLDGRDLAAAAAFVDEDFEWQPALTAGGDLERVVYRGAAGMAQYVEDLDALLADTRFHAESLEPAGPDRVFFHGRVTARGRQSGVRLDVPIWAVFRLRDAKLTHGAGYLNRAEALEAAGLPE